MREGKRYKPKRALEIGTLYGYSAIFIAKMMVDYYANNDNTRRNVVVVVVVTLEIDPNLINIAIKNIELENIWN